LNFQYSEILSVVTLSKLVNTYSYLVGDEIVGAEVSLLLLSYHRRKVKTMGSLPTFWARAPTTAHRAQRIFSFYPFILAIRVLSSFVLFLNSL
jgi:hypothetical protein